MDVKSFLLCGKLQPNRCSTKHSSGEAFTHCICVLFLYFLITSLGTKDCISSTDKYILRKMTDVICCCCYSDWIWSHLTAHDIVQMNLFACGSFCWEGRVFAAKMEDGQMLDVTGGKGGLAPSWRVKSDSPLLQGSILTPPLLRKMFFQGSTKRASKMYFHDVFRKTFLSPQKVSLGALFNDFFCLRRSPDHGTVDVVVVLLLLLGGLLWFRFFSRYWNLYKITFVDNNEVTNRANLQPVVASTFAKRSQKRFCNFLQFCGFLTFWPAKWPQNSNLTSSTHHNLGVPDLFDFIIFFVWPLLLPQKCLLKCFFFTFLLFGCSKTLPNYPNFCQIPPQTFWTESVLVNFIPPYPLLEH